MKNPVLVLSVLGTIGMYILFNSRDVGLCDLNCGDWLNKTQDNFLFFPIILSFSLLTYFMNQRVFNSWWSFARITIPIIFIVSVIINLKLHHNSNSFFNMDNMFDLPILITMYAIFIVGSLWQIWKGYKNS